MFAVGRLLMLLLVATSAPSVMAERSPLMPDAWFEKIPPQLLAGIDSRAKNNLYYRKPLGPHPQVFRKTGPSKYSSVYLPGMKLKKNASAQEKYCWDVFVSGGLDCSRLRPTLRPESDDILAKARTLSHTQGMLRAREYLEEAMLRSDSTQGRFESDVIRASRDKSWIAPDSVLRLSKQERSRIGVFVIFGIDLSGDSPNRELIRRAAAEMERLGFRTRLVGTQPAVDYETNARIIGDEFEEMVESVDHVIFVAASKGVADLLTYLFHDGARVAESSRAKIKTVVSLSGVVRGSNMAHWLSEGKMLGLDLVRAVIASRPTRPMEGIEALARDPWEKVSRTQLRASFPNLKWISVSMLPGGDDGLVPGMALMTELQLALIRHGPYSSPSDGLVESAATILPPGTGVPQRIVRGYGPHALAKGRFLNGELLAPLSTDAKGDVDPAAGAEILSSFMRALDSAILAESIAP